MGGYRRPRTTYKLQFEEHPGLEVTAVGMSVGRLLELSRLADELRSSSVGLDAAAELFAQFVRHIDSWNLTDEDDQPLPVTAEGMLSLEMGFALDMVFALIDAVADVPAPLDRTSSAGSPSAEVSIPMETLSPSPAS